MAKAKKTQTQAERFLEVARKARIGKSGGTFARDMGKTTMAKQARKPTKMG
jgi:hypothetical protein